MRGVFSALKWIVGVGLLLGLLVGGAGVFLYPKFQEFQRAAAERAKGEMVQVELASVGSLTKTISAPGTVTPRTSVNISSRVSAKIISLPLFPGDPVKEGDIVCELDPKELEARLAAARARLLADEANLKSIEAGLAAERAGLLGVKASLLRAETDFERQQELLKTGDVPASTVDDARAELDRQRSSYEAAEASLIGAAANVEAGKARVKVAQADVDEAEENLGYTVIRAPMDGVVTAVNSREGENVLGTLQNAGTVIMTIADLSEMLVEAQLSELDAPKVREGQAVQVSVNGYPDRDFKGQLRRLGLQSKLDNNQTKYFDAEVVLELEEGERLFAGLTANVEIEVATFDDVVIVPSQAVLEPRVDELPQAIRESNEHVDRDKTFARAVYVLVDGKARLRPVTVAASNLTKTALSGGLGAEDLVITGPYKVLQMLKDDMAVRRLDEEEQKGGVQELDEPVTTAGAGSGKSGV